MAIEDISGRLISAISGETVSIAGGVSVSGNVVQISGQIVTTTALSGEAIRLSGISVIATSTISSGLGVIIQSGAGVTIASGVGVIASGDTLRLSGINVITGAASGTGVIIQSGAGVITTTAIGANTLANPIALQAITAAPRVVISSEIDVTAAINASFMVRLGRLSASAFTAGVNFRIEESHATSGDNSWYPLAIFTSALGSSVATELITTNTSGTTNLTVLSLTGFAVGNIIHIANITESISEFGRISNTTSGVIIIEDNLLINQSGSTIYNQSELYVADIDCSSKTRLRIVVDGSAAAQNFAAEARSILRG